MGGSGLRVVHDVVEHAAGVGGGDGRGADGGGRRGQQQDDRRRRPAGAGAGGAAHLRRRNGFGVGKSSFFNPAGGIADDVFTSRPARGMPE